MHRIRNSALLVTVLACLLSGRHGIAQQMVYYQSVTEPLLLLIREPTVLDELKLTARQRNEIEAFNRGQDTKLVSLRNQPASVSDSQYDELRKETRKLLGEVLSQSQQRRLDQISLRVLGLRSLVTPPVVEALKLTPEVSTEIRSSLESLYKQLTELAADSNLTADQRQKKNRKLQQDTQADIVGLLTAEQQRQFGQLLGPAFDLESLGQLRFQAPDFSSDNWLHSEPLSIDQMRGKVVVVYFFAYG